MKARIRFVDFSKQLDTLEQKASDTRDSAHAAVTETRDQLQQRIDKAQADVQESVTDAKQHADQASATAHSKWNELKVDAAARREEADRRFNQHVNNLDTKLADSEADWAESDASDAIDFALFAIDNPRLSVLNAIRARAYAAQVEVRARA